MLKKMKIIYLFLILIVLFSCKNNTEKKSIDTYENKEESEVSHPKESNHWTYQGETGPEHWAELEKQSDCNGKQQSPINIIDIDVVRDSSLKPINIQYSSNVRIHDVTNNGHSIQYNFEKGDYITLNNDKYDLIQIHFHEASEHTINGVRYPLEIHMAHVNKDGKIAILAIMAIEGKSSRPFTFLEKYLPINKGETKQIDANFDLNLNLPDNREYYAYQGSFTTPPCTEGIQWFIFKTPIVISVDQVKLLQNLMPVNNYRFEQPLNGRVVKQYSLR